eukprot:2886701-Heterocapsa_arctica.AAC.1
MAPRSRPTPTSRAMGMLCWTRGWTTPATTATDPGVACRTACGWLRFGRWQIVGLDSIRTCYVRLLPLSRISPMAVSAA